MKSGDDRWYFVLQKKGIRFIEASLELLPSWTNAINLKFKDKVISMLLSNDDVSFHEFLLGFDNPNATILSTEDF